jgi:hypothetical protein
MYVSQYSPAYVFVSKMTLPPEQIVSTIVFVSTTVEVEMVTCGVGTMLPDALAGVVAMDDEDGEGWFPHARSATYSQITLGEFHVPLV